MDAKIKKHFRELRKLANRLHRKNSFKRTQYTKKDVVDALNRIEKVMLMADRSFDAVAPEAADAAVVA